MLETFAGFFNVDMNTLWETPAAEKTASPSKRDMNDLAKFLNKTEGLFGGDTYGLHEEDRQKLRNALEFVFWDAKRQNKRKKD